MNSRPIIQPSLDEVRDIIAWTKADVNRPNLIPLVAKVSAEFLTPAAIYLKITAQVKCKHSFLYESAATTETIGRYSFVGADPRLVLTSGPGFGEASDPLINLDKELSKWRVASIPSLRLPLLTSGAVGYIGYDCIQYFEPRTKRELNDSLKVPESLFMFFNSIIALDHFFQCVSIIQYLDVNLTNSTSLLEEAYNTSCEKLISLIDILNSKEIPLPDQPACHIPNREFTSNIGKSGYEEHVERLKQYIIQGEIIQCVPSQRLTRPTAIHPFNVYRSLRRINPSPYLFYIDCEEFQIIGASPELLIKSDGERIISHPIAGTTQRGQTASEDNRLAEELRCSIKDRAEHIMLVDLARNDLNRVCDPLTVQVDQLMVVQRFSHVQHLVSEVSGVLRKGYNRFDAFRSVFPAGTTTGAPKIRAMELISELEGEKRGIYAGAVGYFCYDSVLLPDRLEENFHDTLSVVPGVMDLCIAIRTMVMKDGVVYMQAGGGIVFDSDASDEYNETLNKLAASMKCVVAAEHEYGQN